MGAGVLEAGCVSSDADPAPRARPGSTAGRWRSTPRRTACETASATCPTDRKQFGLLLEQDIKQNAAMAAMKDFNIGASSSTEGIRTVGEECSRRLQVKTPSVNQLLGKLSGGNQQKGGHSQVVDPQLQKSSSRRTHPRYRRRREGRDLRAAGTAIGQGKAILMISSELPEVLRMSHRIAVMAHGHHHRFPRQRGGHPGEHHELATVGKAQLKRKRSVRATAGPLRVAAPNRSSGSRNLPCSRSSCSRPSRSSTSSSASRHPTSPSSRWPWTSSAVRIHQGARATFVIATSGIDLSFPGPHDAGGGLAGISSPGTG